LIIALAEKLFRSVPRYKTDTATQTIWHRAILCFLFSLAEIKYSQKERYSFSESYVNAFL